MILWKLRKSDMILLIYSESFSLKTKVKSPYVCKWMVNKQHLSIFSQFSYNKIHEATFKLVLTQRQDMLIVHTELLLQIIEW